MSNQQTVLTTLGCAGSLAAMLAMTSPAMATSLNHGMPTLGQEDSNPITDALGCICAVCTSGVQQPAL